MRFGKIMVFAFCIGFACSFVPATSWCSEEESGAAMEMPEMIVTANKIEEDVQDVPQSITVIDDEVLKEKEIKDVTGIISEIPNMNYTSNYAGQVNFRGLSTSLLTSNNPVVIYIDGVPSTNQYGYDASLVNAERVEVLRGPQGTLYGKDAIGGVIKVVTKEPVNEWHGSIGAGYGSYNDMEGSLNVSGSLIEDKLYLGLNGRYQQDDGWITNDCTGDDKFNKSSLYNLGSYLLYTPTDRFTAKLTLSNDYSEIYGITGYGLPGGTRASEFDRDDAEHSSFDEDFVEETEATAQSLHLKYEFDSVTLTSTTTHRDVETDGISDRDAQANTSYDGLIGFSATDSETWTEELRLSSNNTEGVRWVTGAYFDIEDIKKGPDGIQMSFSGNDYEMSYRSKTESETQALFGQIMIPFLDSFELTLGARYQRIDKEMDLDTYYGLVGAGGDLIYSIQPDETWDVFLPKAALSYKLNDTWITYASVAKGYMPGGFNFYASSGSEEDISFGPEQSINYEIGAKAEFARARLAAAVFYMDIDGIQISKYDNEIDMWVTDNAGGAYSLGAELELTYFLTDSIELSAALGIIEAEYDDYDTGTVVYDGESISGTPSHTARIGVAYYHPNGFYARGDVRSKGEVPYYDSTNNEFSELDSYITADVKVGYRFNGYEVYAYCNNLTDEEYITSFQTARMKSVASYGDPRAFGIGARYNF